MTNTSRLSAPARRSLAIALCIAVTPALAFAAPQRALASGGIDVPEVPAN